MAVARIDDDKVRGRQLGLDPRRAAALRVDVEAQRSEPTRWVRRDLGHRTRDVTSLAIGTAAEIIGSMNVEWQILGEPLEDRLKLPGGWRTCGRRSLSNCNCPVGRSGNAAARVD
ncbi:MAG: hypothetical protein M3R53_01640, partial [Candidatus Eremiobacteraeota bacterium]|nr:hypothetical protein [Candidatus Eremiobacteraeota bacterium]